MSVIKVLRDLNGLFNYSTDENPTSQQDYQKAVKNWVKTIVSLVDSNLWQPETEYFEGEMVKTPSLSKDTVLYCLKAGTTGAAEPDYTDMGIGDIITDGTVVWRVQTITSGLPVGFQYFQTNPNVPAGSLPLLGGEYSRETYADLWAWVQTQNGYLIEESAWQAKAAANGGNVPFYSKGDGSTTFRVPALKCWVRGANSINEVGGYLAAGLPNITGGFGLRPVDGGQNVTWETNNGAIKTTTQTDDRSSCVTKSSSYGPLMDVTIDASRSSAIYGKSSTVQPPSIVGLWCVKAYGTVTNVGSTDVANISTGLTQAETRISAAETRISAAVPTGVVQAFAGNTLPNGWLLCDGSAVSRTDYAALYAVIGTTYGAGNGSTTFNLPNLVDKFVEGSATAGTVKSAGLPNIKGSFNDSYGNIGDFNDATEAFYLDQKDKKRFKRTADDNNASSIVNLDASLSSPVYGKSSTVQPPALTMRYIIKY